MAAALVDASCPHGCHGDYPVTPRGAAVVEGFNAGWDVEGCGVGGCGECVGLEAGLAWGCKKVACAVSIRLACCKTYLSGRK